MDTALLAELLQSPIAYHPVFARVAGGATTGIFLSQLYYWSPRASHPDGWIYKDSAEWQAETMLTCAEQRTARRYLRKLGLLKEDQAHKYFDGISAFDKTLCFRLDVDQLYRLICQSKPQNTPSNPATAEDADLAARDEKREKHKNAPQTPVTAEDADLAARPNNGSQKNHSSMQKQQFTLQRSQHRPPPPHEPAVPPENAVVVEEGKGETQGVDSGLDELVEAALFAEKRAGKVIRSEARWRIALRKRLETTGVTDDDRAALEAYRVAHRKAAAAKGITPGLYRTNVGSTISVGESGTVDVTYADGRCISFHAEKLAADVANGIVVLIPA